MPKPPTYWDYLKLDSLLDLQGGLEDEVPLKTDELHFIVVHQAFELWFKLCLREIRLARDHLAAPTVPEEKIPYVVHHLRRVAEIFKLAVDQFRVMETLTPQDFLDFRDKLTPASGFQSFQMREMEILLGLRDVDRLTYAGTDPLEHIRTLGAGTKSGEWAWQRICDARAENSLRDALHEWLYRTPIEGSSPGDANDASVVDAFIAGYLATLHTSTEQQAEMFVQLGLGDPEKTRARFAATEQQADDFLRAADIVRTDGQSDADHAHERSRMQRIRAALLFIESYRDLPLLAWPRLLLDTIVETEEQMLLFRSRHARMVERLIGRRVGTGGSSGVDYLDSTTKYRVFTELWAVRTLLLPRDSLPALKNAAFYGFAGT